MQRPKIFMFFMISPELIINARIKNLISLKKLPPPLHPRKLQPPPALAPPPPPLSDINNAHSYDFEQLHKFQQCKKCKHLPPISPFSFFHFSSKKKFCVWGVVGFEPLPHTPIT